MMMMMILGAAMMMMEAGAKSADQEQTADVDGEVNNI